MKLKMARNISSAKEEREEMAREAELSLGPALQYEDPFSKMRRFADLYPKASSLARVGGGFVILPNTITKQQTS
jgi:hypothetical protein